MMKKEELIKEKNPKQDKIKEEYSEKIKLLKDLYSIEFEIDYLKNNVIDKIKFLNINYRDLANNVKIIYDNNIKKINFISYNFNQIPNSGHKIVKELCNGIGLKLLIEDILEINREYQEDLKTNSSQFDNLNEINDKKSKK